MRDVPVPGECDRGQSSSSLGCKRGRGVNVTEDDYLGHCLMVERVFEVIKRFGKYKSIKDIQYPPPQKTSEGV